MRIDVGVQITLNDGSTMVMSNRSEATPDLNFELRANAVEALARAYEVMAEVRAEVERQAALWTDQAVVWPTRENPNDPIYRPPDDGPHGHGRRGR